MLPNVYQQSVITELVCLTTQQGQRLMYFYTLGPKNVRTYFFPADRCWKSTLWTVMGGKPLKTVYSFEIISDFEYLKFSKRPETLSTNGYSTVRCLTPKFFTCCGQSLQPLTSPISLSLT